MNIYSVHYVVLFQDATEPSYYIKAIKAHNMKDAIQQYATEIHAQDTVVKVIKKKAFKLS